MSPAFNAVVFGIFGLAAIWGISKNIKTGTATSRGWTYTLEDNPIGFCLIVCFKAAVVGFAIAEIPYAFGLSGDPIKNIQHVFPFLPTHPRQYY
jgi:hypothetical protein